MSEQAFIEELKSHRIELWLDKGKLRLRAPENAVSPAMLEKIKLLKPGIVRHLEASQGRELSFPQSSLWTLYNLHPDSPAYNVACSIEIEEAKLGKPFDINAIRKCLHSLLQRHEILRSNIKEGAEGPRLWTPLNFQLDCEVFDCSDKAQEDVFADIEKEIDLPFDLRDGAICRFRIFDNKKGTLHLVLVTHHIAVDFWSLEILLKELNIMYAAASQDEPAYLPELTKKYGDVVIDQQQYLESADAQLDWAYWAKKLAGDLPLLELGNFRPKVDGGYLKGNKLRRTWSKEKYDKLVSVSRENARSPFVFTLSTFFVLLAKYTNKKDILIGMPTTGRTDFDYETIVGHFINALPLRVELNQNLGFSECMEMINTQVIQSLEHQRYPFPKMVQNIPNDREASGYSPIFQCLFNWNQNRGEEGFDKVSTLGQMRLATSNGITGASHELTVSVVEMEAGCQVVWNYSQDHFSSPFIAEFAQAFDNLVDRVLENPQQIIRDIPLDNQHTKAIVAANRVSNPFNIYNAFLESAKACPTQLAVSDADASYSYKELNERATKLALSLEARGIKCGQRVGLLLPMSCDAVAVMLACWKLGASYVPIDINNPRERITYICSDADLALLVTHNTVKQVQIAADYYFVTQCELKTLVDFVPTNELSAAHDNSTLIAYSVYTSGSTGKPKGVEVSHAALSNLVSWHKDFYGLKNGAIASQLAGFGFDAAVWELWPYLCAGAAVKIAPEQIRTDIPQLINWLNEQDINYSFMPTPMAEALLTHHECKSVRLSHLLTGGDKLSFSHVETLPFSLINHYGPTEFAVVATCHPVELDGRIPPIGLPIAGNTAYVLDAYGNQLPNGAVGELTITGASLAQGYLSRPALTAASFVPNPHSNQPGDRMYRTGDLVRRNVEGIIEFVGRADQQVKLRGYRIELSEIEHAISKLDGVENNVVRLHHSDDSGSFLAAYIVMRNAEKNVQDLLVKNLPDSLSASLPGYMIPSSVIVIPEIPLTVNGKIDFRALPKPELGASRSRYVAPRTPAEELLKSLWEKQFNRSQISVTDDFFALGGHSLMAMQLTAKIQQVTGVACSIAMLFKYPTIESLVLAMASGGTANKGSLTLPVLVSDLENRFAPFPLSDIQQTYFIGRSGAYDLADIATQVFWESEAEFINVERLSAAWNLVIRRHDMLRMVLTQDHQQKILASVPLYQVDIEDLSNLPEADAQNRLEAIRNTMWLNKRDGYTWPLFENRVTRIAPNKFYFHLIIDALNLDGWSTVLLLQELMAAYIGKAAQLPTISVSYRDYIIAVENIRAGALYKNSKQYWLKRIADFPGAPELPLINGGIDKAEGRFRKRGFSLDNNQWNQLKNTAKQLDVTPSNLLLGAYCYVLSKWSKDSHFAINLTLFNRLPLHPQIHEVLGDFTSLTLLEVNTKTFDFKELVKKIQQQLWLDLEHHYFGGVEVLREIVRISGNKQKAIMPVVFTSMLTSGMQTGEFSLLDEVPECDKSFINATGRGRSQTSQVWLDHVVFERDGTLQLTWDALDDLFLPGTLDAMFAIYESFVKYLASDADFGRLQYPGLPVLQLEQRVNINNTAVDLPLIHLHEMVKLQVLKTPSAVALIDGDNNLTYQQLWRAAKVIAHAITRRGVKPNQLIAVLMGKGWEQVVACLAILQSGAAYLPIDASLPETRIRQILTQGEVELAIIQPSLEVQWSVSADLKTLTVEPALLNADEVEELPLRQHMSDLAYVIFTSGSTGVPKGVMIDHRGAANTVLDINKRFNVSSNDKVLALSSLSFDLSVYDIFGLLAAGGTLVIPRAEGLRDPGYWLRLISEHQVTIFNSVPALAQLLTEFCLSQQKSLPTSLRIFMMSGDWIPVTLPDHIRAASGRGELDVISLGGATEASIWSVYFPIHNVDSGWASIPYGKPLGNQTLHVLAEDLTPCPDWVEGDIYIGGIGVAKGYWRDQEKTAASFIVHPQTGDSLYRTGDRGCYMGDGNIEFLGRKDAQVKVNGYRIELEEIEAVLLKHRKVKQAVSIVQNNIQGGASIAAYVVLEENIQASNDAIVDLQQMAEKLALQISKPAISKKYTANHTIALTRPSSIYAFAGERVKGYGNSLSEEQKITVSDLDLGTLADWLGCLAQYQIDDAILPKYYYPSAGSLNPVQTYLVVHREIPGQITRGIYYYHPSEHSIQFAATYEVLAHQWNSLLLPSVSTLFVAEMDAIAPAYADSSREFCELEAGYMAELLAQHGSHYQLLASSPELTLGFDLNTVLNLNVSQQPLSCVDWFYAPAEERVSNDDLKPLPILHRQSFREFSGTAIAQNLLIETLTALAYVPLSGQSTMQVYICQQQPSNKLKKLISLFKFDLNNGQLHHLNDVEIEEDFHYGENISIFNGADCSVFLVSDDSEIRACHYRDAGRLGQMLMSVCGTNGIGFCPIGSVNSTLLKTFFNFDSATTILHSFIGGVITAEQLQVVVNSSNGHEILDPIADIKEFLLERLPEYMVPEQIIKLAHMPLTDNGKVARDKLPKPDVILRSKNQYRAPTNDTEEKLVNLWKKVLGVEAIGINDNFFEAGGNSMLLIHVHRELTLIFGVELPMVELFRNSDIASLASYLTSTEKEHSNLEQIKTRVSKQREAAQRIRNSKTRPSQSPRSE